MTTRPGAYIYRPSPTVRLASSGALPPWPKRLWVFFSLFDKLILKGCVGGAVLGCCSRIEWSVRFFAGFYLVEDWKDVFVREVFVNAALTCFGMLISSGLNLRV